MALQVRRETQADQAAAAELTAAAFARPGQAEQPAEVELLASLRASQAFKRGCRQMTVLDGSLFA